MKVEYKTKNGYKLDLVKVLAAALLAAISIGGLILIKSIL